MHLAPWAGDAAILVVVGVLAWAAWCDVATRTIPDSACLALALSGLVVRGTAGLAELATSAAIAVSLFILLVFLHSRASLGGGDVKLIAAIALGLSPLGAYRFIVVTALSGGVLAMIHLCLRRVPSPPASSRPSPSLLARVVRAELWRVRRKGSLPYGVAIACGGAWVALAGWR